MTHVASINLGDGIEAEFVGLEVTLTDAVTDATIVLTLEKFDKLIAFVRKQEF